MKQSSHNDDARNQLARYQILMQRRQHIERIFWSRIQILHLIQAGVLGGSYLMWRAKDPSVPPVLYAALLFMGIVLTIILLIICKHDWKDARINDNDFQSLGYRLGIIRTAPRWLMFGRKIKTHRLLYAVMGLFILFDVLLLFYFGLWWGMAATITLIILAITALTLKRLGRLKKEPWPPRN